jgi:hypothetical protein
LRLDLLLGRDDHSRGEARLVWGCSRYTNEESETSQA